MGFKGVIFSFLLAVSSTADLFAEGLCEKLLSRLHHISPEEFLEKIGARPGESLRLTFEDWDDNLVVMSPSRIYVMNHETQEIKGITTDEYARFKGVMGKAGSEWEKWHFFDYLVHPDGKEELITLERRNTITSQLGQPGAYQGFSLREGSWIDFRDKPNPQIFQNHMTEITRAPRGWIGPRWLYYSDRLRSPHSRVRTGIITTRGHDPKAFLEAHHMLTEKGFLPASPERELIFPIYNANFPQDIGNWPHERKLSVLKAMIEILERVPPKSGERHTLEFADDDIKTIDHLRAEFSKMMDAGELKNIRVLLTLTALDRIQHWEFESKTLPLSVVPMKGLDALVRGRLVLGRSEVESYLKESGQTKEQLMLALTQNAKAWAQPPISNYFVGVVGEGKSGNLYLGFNLEFNQNTLSQTSHGEQTMLALMAMHGESGIQSIALSAAPCGHCRQFLNEVKAAENIDIYIAGRAKLKLGDLLPDAFGPKDLGVVGDVLNREHQPRPELTTSDAFSLQVAERARESYAPYSKGYAAVGIETIDGQQFFGIYLENAAFNPSLSPLQVALVQLIGAGHQPQEIKRVVMVESALSKISHESSLVAALATVAPTADLRVYRVPF